MIFVVEFGDRIGPKFPEIVVPLLLRSDSTGALETGRVGGEKRVPRPWTSTSNRVDEEFVFAELAPVLKPRLANGDGLDKGSYSFAPHLGLVNP